MKKINIILFLFFVLNCYSQITRVTYKNGIYGQDIDSLRISSEKFKNLSKDQITLLERILKEQAKIEFELLYDKKCAIFQKKEVLNLNENNSDIGNKLVDNRKFYKNNILKEKKYQILLDQIYNVTTPFDEYSWIITNETKTINGYKCYKATTTMQDTYNAFKKTSAVFYPIVWFTPDIPASFGPQGLDGLPGLVLEASINGKKYIYATKIEFDAQGVKEIGNLKLGKEIKLKEYEEILNQIFEKTQH